MLKVLCLSLMVLSSQAQAITNTQLFKEGDNTVLLKGVPVRKGTIASTTANGAELNRLLSDPSKDNTTAIEEILADQRQLSQGLLLVDLLTMQPLENWLKYDDQQGRMMVAVLTIQEDPTIMTPGVRKRLLKIKGFAHPILKREIEKVV